MAAARGNALRRDEHRLSGRVVESAAHRHAHELRARRRGFHVPDDERRDHGAVCYRRMVLRRARGALLRFVRRRALCALAGIALVVPAAWIEFVAKLGDDVGWWADGLALVVGATGLALLWTAIVGVAPDWVDDGT